jgi:hypothetical protein
MKPVYVYGIKAIVKTSGGRSFLSRAVPWADEPSKMPPAVRARTEAFTDAVPKCVPESKAKHGTVWGVSDYNKCIGKALKKAGKAL